jgi:hypothetical protein
MLLWHIIGDSIESVIRIWAHEIISKLVRDALQ